MHPYHFPVLVSGIHQRFVWLVHIRVPTRNVRNWECNAVCVLEKVVVALWCCALLITAPVRFCPQLLPFLQFPRDAHAKPGQRASASLRCGHDTSLLCSRTGHALHLGVRRGAEPTGPFTTH